MKTTDFQPALGNRQTHGAAVGRVQDLAAERSVGMFHFRRTIAQAAADHVPLGRAPVGKAGRMALVSYVVGKKKLAIY